VGPHHIGEIQKAKGVKELPGLEGGHQETKDQATQSQDVGENPFKKGVSNPYLRKRR
jgi:hypothetical protein